LFCVHVALEYALLTEDKDGPFGPVALAFVNVCDVNRYRLSLSPPVVGVLSILFIPTAGVATLDVILLTIPLPLAAPATPAATCDTIFASCHTVPFTDTTRDDPRLVCARPLAIHIFAPENHAAPVPNLSNIPARVSVIRLPKTPVHPSASAAFEGEDVATE
jgi:hypothetical protein